MKSYAELKTLIEDCGVHPQLGPVGRGYNIEQNPHELATFLVRMQELGVQSVLEIGTGYKAGLARFLAHEMGWTVTTVDVQDYGHAEKYPDITFEYTDGVEYPVWQHKFELVFIDGSHTYDDVSFDYDYYSHYAAKAIAFHDIAGLRDCMGARKFWWELRETKKENKFWWSIAEDEQCAGIGWIER